MFDGVELPKKVGKKILFIGDDDCEKNKIIAAYKTGILQTDKNPLLQTNIPIKKALQNKFGQKPTKVLLSFFNMGPETDEMSRRLLYGDKDVYVFMFSFRSIFSLQSTVLKWAAEAFGSYKANESAQIVLLGVHAEIKNLEPDIREDMDTVYESIDDLHNLLAFSNNYIRNTALALNANAYVEISNNDIQSIKSGIDSIIKLGLLKENLYPLEKVDGYIEIKMPKDWGRLSVTVLRAAGLVPKDSNGLSDPYSLFGWCTDSKWETVVYRHQTKRKKETLAPEWSEEDNNHKVYQFSENVSKYQFLKVQIWDHDITSKDDFEGEANIPISIILSNPTKEVTVKLTTRSRDGIDEELVTGTVTLSWKFRPRKRQLPKLLKSNNYTTNLSKATSSSSKSNTKTTTTHENAS